MNTTSMSTSSSNKVLVNILVHMFIQIHMQDNTDTFSMAPSL